MLAIFRETCFYSPYMKPKEIVDYLEKRGMSRRDLADKLGVTEQAISFWLKQGWITYERQCHVQLELPRSGLVASWDDVPKDKRTVVEDAA